ncbi:PorT family protein [Adhaeribacter swui]|uniref:PorT family protein n=1 Tax=Adhaeribacter swui TaxID=2086471 RepID=A0A7G7GCB2_9BACT|nr:porin family protein [Adhaeribacter swui]QNF34796.1 PorT family protein [Adhaeribacter swui]
MKKALFLSLLALLVLSLTTVKAQTSGFNVGIKAGVNYTKMPADLNEVSNESGKAGYTVGIFARMGDALFIQPEVNFTTVASKYAITSQSYHPKIKQVNVPVLVGYKLINSDALNFRVAVGPDFGYTLNKPDAPAGFDYKRVNVGGAINAGIDIGNITLDARYSRGFTNINKDLDAKANTYSLAVGFKIF